MNPRTNGTVLLVLVLVSRASLIGQAKNEHLAKADSLFGKRQFESAAAAYQVALQDFDTVATKPDSAYAYVLHSIGACFATSWRWGEARPYLERALALREQIFPPDHQDVAVTLHTLAYISAYVESEGMYKRALSIWQANLQRSPDQPRLRERYAGTLMNIGLLYSNYGNYEAGLPYYQKSLAEYKKSVGFESQQVAKLLNQIGNLYWHQRKVEEARDYYEQALAIHQKTLDSLDRDLAMSLNNVAATYSKLGRYAEAEALLRRALMINEKVYGPTHNSITSQLINLAFCYSRQGKFDEAKPYERKALYLEEKNLGPFHGELGEDFESASTLYRLWGDVDTCFYYAERSLEILTRHFRGQSVVLPEKDAIAFSRFIRSANETWLAAYFDYPSPERLSKAADHILQGKGQLADELWSRRESEAVGSLPELSGLYETWKRSLGELSRMYSTSGAGNVKAHRAEVDSLTRYSNDLEAKLVRASARFRLQKETQIVTAERVRSLLPTGTCLVEYLKYNYFSLKLKSPIPHYVVAVIARDGTMTIKDLGEAQAIDTVIQRYRQHLLEIAQQKRPLSGKDEREYLAIASQLYQLVWAPIADVVPKASTVFVAPDGGLNLVSFAGLTSIDGSYLIIEHYPIHYLSSGRDLLRLQAPAESGSGLLAFGDPDYNASASLRFASAGTNVALPMELGPSGTSSYATRNVRSGCGDLYDMKVDRLAQTRTEVEEVAQSWRDKSRNEEALILLGVNASEEEFKRNASGKAVIHLATHGYFLDGQCVETSRRDVSTIENPLLLSGLFLAGANLHGSDIKNEEAEDGIVTALEVSAMDLRGTDLVVLSACETGLGKVQQGEGVYGLRRAFQMAGARAVVSSLWQIPDDETMRFMKTLYSTRAATYPELMQQVTLKRIKEARLRGRPTHPFTWGAFVATGDWRIKP